MTHVNHFFFFTNDQDMLKQQPGSQV